MKPNYSEFRRCINFLALLTCSHLASYLLVLPAIAQTNPETDVQLVDPRHQNLPEVQEFKEDEPPKINVSDETLPEQENEDRACLFSEQEVFDETSLTTESNLDEELRLEGLRKIQVSKIKIEDNTVLNDEIGKLVSFYENRSLSLEELLCIRSEITKLYVYNGKVDNNGNIVDHEGQAINENTEARGYITSGAFLPIQQLELKQGIVTIQVVEGKIEEVNISELNHVDVDYVLSRLKKATRPPLLLDRLEEGLQLLQLKSDLFESIKADLRAGTSSGQNILDVEIEERSPLAVFISGGNTRPSNLGEWEANIQAQYNNLFGIGDRLNASFGITEGLESYSANYAFPFNASDGTINLRYSKNDSLIVSEDFRRLGIRSDSNNLSFGLAQPISQSPTGRFALGLDFDIRDSQTFILDDIPFSFSIGPEEGKSKVSALRFSQDWYQRNPYRIVAASSQFSFGIDAFDATINDTGTDASFAKWLGQFQYLQRISDSEVSLLVQLNTQLTPDSLLSLEKFSVGGTDTVRGYPFNYLVADNGINLSAELRVPFGRKDTWVVRPFFDVGKVWNSDTNNPETESISSLGLGLTWRPLDLVDINLDYGIPLTDVEGGEDSLQSSGTTFSVIVKPVRF